MADYGDAKNEQSGQCSNETSSSDDEFYTAPSSPSFLQDSSDDEQFDESRVPDSDIFLEGYFNN